MIRRARDILGAGLGLILLAPLLIWIAWRIRAELGAPVLFRQVRAGQGGRPFEMIKFRTMTDAADAAGRPLPDAARLTDLGRWLRATSLDELPELWNVLRGEMSLVGPRPLLTDYVPLYSPAQARRLALRPGLTGWAQVNGRNRLSWEARFALDVWYVDHRSHWVDLVILWRTIGRVLARDGVTAPGEATMPRFTGTGTASEKAR